MQIQVAAEQNSMLPGALLQVASDLQVIVNRSLHSPTFIFYLMCPPLCSLILPFSSVVDFGQTSKDL